MRRRLQWMAAGIALLSAPAQAYYHYVHYTSRTGPFTAIYEKFAVKSVTFFVSDQGPAVFAPSDTFGSLLGQVKQALAAWDAVPTSDLRIGFGGLQAQNQAANSPSGQIVFDELPPGLLGMAAPLANGTTIVRSTVTLADNTNRGVGPSYTEAFFTTAVHEIGHALGLQHTWTSSAMSQYIVRNTTRARPLDADDVAALSLLYGKSNWQAEYGSIAGRVNYNNGSPAVLASVVAINPTGAAVSTLTNPDGTYRIDGIPAGNYLLYVHPLPPDATPSDNSGLRLPQDPNGQTPNSFQPSAPFNTVFFPGTTDLSAAANIAVGRGSASLGLNFIVQQRAAVSAYDMLAYTFLDIARGSSFYDDRTSRNWAAVTPGVIDATQSAVTLKIQAAYGDTPLPQTATLMGGFAITPRGDYLRVYNDSTTGKQSVALDLAIPSSAGTGPRHLVLNYGNDLYVLPAAVTLVQRPVPTISSVESNGDNSVTITGRNLDPKVYFGGLPGTVTSASSNALTVTPPPGIGGNSVAVTVFTADGQNSTMLGQAPPTYTYNGGGSPQITNVSVRSLGAGATSMVEITAANTRFTEGQVALGFGSPDIVVQRLWVTNSNTLRANIQTSGAAPSGSSEISVVSGFQVMAQPGGFNVQGSPFGTAALAGPTIALPIGNGDPTQPAIYPGSTASIYAFNLGQSASAIQVTLNDAPVQVLGLAPDHVNIQVPSNFPTGPAVVRLTVAGFPATPVLMPVDTPPPFILRVTGNNGASYDQSRPALAGDVINVVVSGLDAAVQNNLSRLTVSVAGVSMPVQEVTSFGGGQYQIRFYLAQSFGATTVPLSVAVDGSASAAFQLPTR